MARGRRPGPRRTRRQHPGGRWTSRCFLALSPSVYPTCGRTAAPRCTLVVTCLSLANRAPFKVLDLASECGGERGGAPGAVIVGDQHCPALGHEAPVVLGCDAVAQLKGAAAQARGGHVHEQSFAVERRRAIAAARFGHGGAKPEGDVCLPGPWCPRAHRHTRHQGRRGALRSTSGASAAGGGVRSATGKGNSGTAPPNSVEPATRGVGSAATGADASAASKGEVASGTGAGVSVVVIGAGASPWG